MNPKNLKNGYEQYETFSRKNKEYIQYDYRHTDGELFSCIGKNLNEARAKKEQWQSNKELSCK